MGRGGGRVWGREGRKMWGGGVERGRRGESRERGMAFLSFLLIPFFFLLYLGDFLISS